MAGHGRRFAYRAILAILFGLCLLAGASAQGRSAELDKDVFHPGKLRPTASQTKLNVGDAAPDFSLPDLSGRAVKLSEFRGKKNVVLSFIPAAWTPVCSQQWPGYNIARGLFEENAAVVLGISVDNKPTLYAWTNQMGDLWFPVLSDFWPHGAVAQSYGVLREDGVSERALYIVDKQGAIRYIDVHDINTMPRLEDLIGELKKIGK